MQTLQNSFICAQCRKRRWNCQKIVLKDDVAICHACDDGNGGRPNVRDKLRMRMSIERTKIEFNVESEVSYESKRFKE